MIKPMAVILIVLSFFYPPQVSWIFIAFFFVLETYLLTASRKNKFSFIKDAPFNEEEQVVIQKYYLYFRFPLTSKSYSSSLSLIALSAFILVPWLLYNHLWLQAIVIGLNYFVAQYISTALNVRFYLHYSVEELKQEENRKEMELVDSICNKLTNWFHQNLICIDTG